MNKEHIRGAVSNLVGKTKEVAGNVRGDGALETKGKVDQFKGAVHNAAGDVKDAGRELLDRLKR